MKRKTAYNIAIHAIELEMKQYYPGHFEYLRGAGPTFEFAEKDHKRWVRLSEAKKVMEQERDQKRMI